MKRFLKKMIGSNTGADQSSSKLEEVYNSFADFTMIPKEAYIENLRLSEMVKDIKGCVVECGVWRGGMIAGIAFNNHDTAKDYYLFDSFEGLPEAKEIDGQRAIQWQNDPKGEFYFDNCRAEEDFAVAAMKKTGMNYFIEKGWFDQTVPSFNNDKGISLLRLDGDWYDSTIVCLRNLFPKINPGGMVIIDDYYTWDGCSKALHDYLSEIKSPCRIVTSSKGICYIIKD